MGTNSMYTEFINCMKENNDEEKHSILKRILKMKLNGSRLIMITKQDIENPYFPIKFINHENQSIFLQIILKLNHFHDDSFKEEEFECIEWKDEYYESKHIFTEIDEIDDIEEETIKEEQISNEIIENENDIKHEDSTKEEFEIMNKEQEEYLNPILKQGEHSCVQCGNITNYYECIKCTRKICNHCMRCHSCKITFYMSHT